MIPKRRLAVGMALALTAMMSLAPPSVAATPPLLPFDGTGDLLAIDNGAEGIIRITPQGASSVFVTEAEILAAKPGMTDVDFSDHGLAVGADGTVYFTAFTADGESASISDLYQRTPSGTVSLLTANAAVAAVTGSDPADLENLAPDAGGTIYLIDDAANDIVKIDPSTGAVTLFVDEAALEATVGADNVDLDANLVIDESGNVYFANSNSPSVVWKATSAGAVTIHASTPNEVQAVTVDATGGTFTLTFGTDTTSPIAFNASAASVESALVALPSIGAGGVTVTGSGAAADPWYVEFTGANAATNVAQMTSDPASLTGGAMTATVTTEVDGGAFDDIGSYLTRAPDGSLTVIDHDDDWIYRITTDGQISSLIRENVIENLIGVDADLGSGIAYDDFGRLYIAEENTDNVLRFDTLLNGSVLATNAQIATDTGFPPSFEGAVAFLAGPAPVLSSSPASGPAGTTITVNGTDCDLASAYAIFSFDPGNPSTATVAADRTWTVTRAVPAGTSPGAYSIIGGCGSNTAANRYPSASSFTVEPVAEPVIPGNGYWEVASDGGVFTFGGATFYGSTGSIKLNKPVVGMAATPSGNGYWLVASDGGIFSFGDANFYGSMGATPLNKPIVGMALTPSGLGYWMVASDGGIFSFGDATFNGSMGGKPLNSPIVNMSPTPLGDGYYLVAGDGGVFTFGDAGFFGSMGGTKLNSPVVDISVRQTGLGYWMAAGDGGIFTFGDADFYGSMGATRLNKPMVGSDVSNTGLGYWLVATDGGMFTFGDAPFFGSMGGTPLNEPMVDMVAY